MRTSNRAKKIWARLISWYGTRLSDSYGTEPPEDWAKLFDRTDDERLNDALLSIRRESPVHPPTLGQIEGSIPKRETGNSGPSKTERLAFLMLKTHDTCHHQRSRPWNYFGPLHTFELLPKRSPPEYITHPDPRGVQVPPCEECAKPSYRVTLDQDHMIGV